MKLLPTLLGPALLGLLLSGCAGQGADGAAAQPPTDFSRFDRPTAPHTALAAPAGYRPRSGPPPDLVTSPFRVPPPDLLADIKRVAAAQPRTTLQSSSTDPIRAVWIVRSATLNFPDRVVAEVSPLGNNGSTLILYSTSLYGYYDFGVNNARLQHWLADLATLVHQQTGPSPGS